jgi:hypothetical protein
MQIADVISHNACYNYHFIEQKTNSYNPGGTKAKENKMPQID